MIKLFDRVKKACGKYKSEKPGREMYKYETDSELIMRAHEWIGGNWVYMGEVKVVKPGFLQGGTRVIVSDGSTSYFRDYLNRNGVESV